MTEQGAGGSQDQEARLKRVEAWIAGQSNNQPVLQSGRVTLGRTGKADVQFDTPFSERPNIAFGMWFEDGAVVEPTYDNFTFDGDGNCTGFTIKATKVKGLVLTILTGNKVEGAVIDWHAAVSAGAGGGQ